jgi:hypothetical protein
LRDLRNLLDERRNPTLTASRDAALSAVAPAVFMLPYGQIPPVSTL